MAAVATSSDAAEGPVMGLINKRLRALRKKYNRITQMEESISQGKTLNKEQEEVLRSKPAVVVLIEELEKLRAPLSAAVTEEITLATQHHQPSSSSDVIDLPPQEASDGADDGDSKLEDLVKLLYFGSLFDVKSQNEFTSIMLTRTYEKGSCLTYDYVTDDSTDPLCDADLVSISQLGSLMISRPADSSLPHKNALERCVEHAKLWLANSEQPIEFNYDVSYASLKEKLKKIMASDYLTITPDPVEVAAAAENYAFQQKEEDASNCKEHESVVQSLQDENQKVEPVTEGEVVYEQQEEGYTQVGAGNAKRDYAPRGPYQNQRGNRGARRGGGGYQNGRGGRGGSGGHRNGGRYESYDNSGGNGYQKSYYSNRGRGRGGGGGGNGHAYNHHQDSNVSAAS